MGCSVYASLVIGVSADIENFWTVEETTDDFASCPEGHKKKGKAKFCSECGGEFETRTHSKQVPTQDLVKFAQKHNVEPQDVWNPDPEYCAEETWDMENLTGLELLNVAPYGSSESDDETQIIGIEVFKLGDILSGGSWGGSPEKLRSMTERDVSEKMAEVAEIAGELGLDGEPELFLTSYCSV